MFELMFAVSRPRFERSFPERMTLASSAGCLSCLTQATDLPGVVGCTVERRASGTRAAGIRYSPALIHRTPCIQ
jgi:hypothetical protein